LPVAAEAKGLQAGSTLDAYIHLTVTQI